jgi:2-dehydropantoate 2-reductase
MRFLVVGAGAVGCLVGGRLTAAGHDAVLVVRDWLAPTLVDSGLRLNISGETLYVPEVAAVTSIKTGLLEFGPFDLVLFTMKAYDTAAAIRELTAATDRPLTVLSLQNGVGNEELLAAALGPSQVIAGVITTPARMPVPGVVRAASGGIGLAPLEPGQPLRSISRAVAAAGFPTRAYADWRGLKWSKLLLNMVGNATAAILDWPPERILADPDLFDVEWRAWHEARAVMRAQDIEVVALPGYRLPWAVALLRSVPRAWLRPLMARLVGRGRGGKMPSLHGDLARGKRRSEARVLNGAVADAGRRLGVPTPVNATLTDTLMQIVHGDADWDDFRGHPERLLAAVRTRSPGVRHTP